MEKFTLRVGEKGRGGLLDLRWTVDFLARGGGGRLGGVGKGGGGTAGGVCKAGTVATGTTRRGASASPPGTGATRCRTQSGHRCGGCVGCPSASR